MRTCRHTPYSYHRAASPERADQRFHDQSDGRAELWQTLSGSLGILCGSFLDRIVCPFRHGSLFKTRLLEKEGCALDDLWLVKGGDDQGGLAGLACRIAVWSSAGYSGRSINYLEAQSCTYLIAEQFSACSIHAAGQIRAHDVKSGIGCMEEPENRVFPAGINAHQQIEQRGQHQAAPALRRDTRQGAFEKIRPGVGLSRHRVYTWQEPLECSSEGKQEQSSLAVIMNLEVVRIDEPTAALDSVNKSRIIALLFGLKHDS